MDNEKEIKETEEKAVDFQKLDYTDEEQVKALIKPEILARIENGDVPSEVKDTLEKLMEASADFVSPDRRSEVAKNLLEDKYGKEFVIARYRGKNMAVDFYRVDAIELTNPDVMFEAHITVDDSSIKDSYSVKMACESIRNKLISNFDFFGGDLDVLVESKYLISDINKPELDYQQIQELFPDNRYAFYIFFLQDSGVINISYDDFKKTLRGFENYTGYFKLYSLDENKLKEVLEYAHSRSKLYDSFRELTEKYLLGKVEFSNGVLITSAEEYGRIISGKE